ncbi:pentapeptide repeat-containing protein [Fusibacter sp. 3D3]|uniref:pentapeptide repeat-containing protein n=1 Tax=Fusibacter sp. 3D3 TaxID=1048380 RepID=UPI0008531B24|nr:pentapeptide repeat-containing protein [Fusibacter sp. 3D3]GAU79955.1 hypothetical protein F3D3_4620 [Fusibacter sp. 3D3]
MTVKKKGYRGKQKSETLFSRWKSDPYKIIIEKIIEKRFISKKTPLVEAKYDLRAANLRKMELVKVSFKNACLSQVCGYQLKLDHCDLSEVKIEMGDFEGAVLKNTNLSDSYLSKCNFSNAVLDHIVFENSTIKDCKFDNATIMVINIENACLEDCDFSSIPNIGEALILGTPKSVQSVKIDMDLLKESAFKSYLEALKED